MYPFSWLYGIVVSLRNFCYDRKIFRIEKAGIPVISVGNMTVGGTGKTPLVEYLVRYLSGKGKKVAVLSRGYGRSASQQYAVGAGETDRGNAASLGDEPYQIAKKFPHATVIANPSRRDAARVAVQNYGAEIVVLDDGFQHRVLARNLDILVINGDNPIEKEPLLPAGRRREPLSALRRANVIAYSWKNGKKKDLVKLSVNNTPSINVGFKPLCFRSLDGSSPIGLSDLKGKACVAFCGIADPAPFREMLEQCGLVIKDFLKFPDHHVFAPTDFARIVRATESNSVDCIITTEKDAARLSAADREIFLQRKDSRSCYLEIEAVIIDGEPIFHTMIDNAVNATI